jgi:hypothetical protein
LQNAINFSKNVGCSGAEVLSLSCSLAEKYYFPEGLAKVELATFH